MTLNIQRSAIGRSAIFALSGRTNGDQKAQLLELIELESGSHEVVLDLKEVRIVDYEVVKFPGQCEKNGVRPQSCSTFVRDWIDRNG